MRLLHISDTHGTLPKLSTDADVIVHSGDLMPNAQRGGPYEADWQANWIVSNSVGLRNWIGSRPFIFTHGNHDFAIATPWLIDAGVDAVCLDDTTHVLNGISFYGIPWTKYFTGAWNRELHPREMQEVINRIPYVNVLVSHGPPLGILDRNVYGERCGCPTMRNALDYGTISVPDVYLCGHIHESNGVCRVGDTLYSNAATTQHIIELP
jgi:Icc-related predicted phosphoesterase